MLIFAAAALPLIGVFGFLVDLGEQARLTSRLRSATDTALLGAMGLSDLEAQRAMIRRFLDSNMGAQDLENLTLNLTPNPDGSLSATASADMPTKFATLFGIETLRVGVTSTALADYQPVDVALVLDNSGSMSNSGRIGSLRTVLTDTLTYLNNTDAFVGDRVRIALVPYSHTVALDLPYADWMTNPNDAGAQSSARYCPEPRPAPRDLNDSRPTLDRFTHEIDGGAAPVTSTPPPSSGDISWSVSIRISLDDGGDTVNRSGSGSATIQAYANDEEEEGQINVAITDSGSNNWSISFPNSYLRGEDGQIAGPAGVSGSGGYSRTWQDSTDDGSYQVSVTITASAPPTPQPTPGYGCAIKTILPLTSNYTLLNQRANDLQATGQTYLERGMVFGWRAIDPVWALDWNAVQTGTGGRSDSAKAVMLMTDGQNTEGSDTDLTALCQRLGQTEDVHVFTVAFQAPSRGQTALENCAAAADGVYFEAATGEELAQSFLDIVNRLRGVRLLN